MTTPVGNAGNRGAQLDATLRDITDTDAGTTARHAPGQHQTEGPALAIGRDVAFHGGVEYAAHKLAHIGPRAAIGGTVATIGVTIVSPLVALSHVVTDADDRGDAMRARMHHDRMRGALAVLEGRAGSEEVRLEMAQNTSYADGVHRAENLARTMNPEELRALVAFVRRAGNEGQAAVCLGRDHGPDFETRYQSDAAFAHGVDFARRLREWSPTQFEARTARFTELEAQQTAARQSTAIRP